MTRIFIGGRVNSLRRGNFLNGREESECLGANGALILELNGGYNVD
jgi:hypothetical protein